MEISAKQLLTDAVAVQFISQLRLPTNSAIHEYKPEGAFLFFAFLVPEPTWFTEGQVDQLILETHLNVDECK